MSAAAFSRALPQFMSAVQRADWAKHRTISLLEVPLVWRAGDPLLLDLLHPVPRVDVSRGVLPRLLPKRRLDARDTPPNRGDKLNHKRRCRSRKSS